MKSKTQNQKPQRRVAGLTIRAALEPRPDSGVNPAADIFRAVKEDAEAANAANAANATSSNAPQTSVRKPNVERQNQSNQSSSATATNRQTAVASNTVKNPTQKDLPRANDQPPRVVSLQPPKTRRFVKTANNNAIDVRADSREVDKTAQLFERTKAEELYSLLHQLTIGAENVCSSVRVRRSDLMASTNIKTRITLDLNLKRLEENGLIRIESRPGEQEGNIYTVFPLESNET